MKSIFSLFLSLFFLISCFFPERVQAGSIHSQAEATMSQAWDAYAVFDFRQAEILVRQTIDLLEPKRDLRTVQAYFLLARILKQKKQRVPVRFALKRAFELLPKGVTDSDLDIPPELISLWRSVKNAKKSKTVSKSSQIVRDKKETVRKKKSKILFFVVGGLAVIGAGVALAMSLGRSGSSAELSTVTVSGSVPEN